MAKKTLTQAHAAGAMYSNYAERPFRRAVIASGVLVCVIAVLLYTPALKNDFVNWDDGLYVYENNFISPLRLETAQWMLTSLHATNWHPLTWLSHAVDYSLFGLNPAGHHLTSILLHGLNTLLVLLLSIQLTLTAQSLDKAPTSSDEKLPAPLKTLIAGCMTALLFGIHPLHVESVAWVAERKDVLCAFFFLLTLLSYCRFISAADQKKRRAWFTACIALAAAALMAKPMAVTLPFILLLLDLYPFKRITVSEGVRRNIVVVLEKIPFFLLSGISALFTILAQHAGGAFESLERLPVHLRLANALRTPVFYIGKMLWPMELVPYYPFPKAAAVFDLVSYSLSAIVIVCFTAGCLWLWRRKKYLLFTAWAYYLITLLPVIGIMQVGSQAAADRYTYLPSVSIFFLAGIGIAWLFARIAGRKKIMAAGALFTSLGFIAFGQLTVKQITIWRDSETLWQYVIKAFPGRVPVAHNNLGILYDGRGLHDKARKEYEKALASNPAFADALANLGVAYKRQGNYTKAIELYQKALASNPNMAEARNNLGLAYYDKGMYDNAVEEYKKVLAVNPALAATHYNLGLAYYALGMHEKTIEEYKKALGIDPAFAAAHYGLSLMYYEKKNYILAKIHLGKAQQLGYAVDKKTADLIDQAP